MNCLQRLIIMLLTIVIKLFSADTLEFMRRAVTDGFPSGVQSGKGCSVHSILEDTN